jgi:transposase
VPRSMPFVSVDQRSRLLLDLPKSLRLDADAVEESKLLLMLRSAARSAVCPWCDGRSSRVHSEYIRVVDDARVATVTVTAKLVVRRFRCEKSGCERSRRGGCAERERSADEAAAVAAVAAAGCHAAA